MYWLCITQRLNRNILIHKPQKYSFMYKSGVYFRAYELEKKGVMLTPSKLSGDIQGRYDEKNKLSLIDKKEIWKEHKLNDVLNEYIMWKRTFFDKD